MPVVIAELADVAIGLVSVLLRWAMRAIFAQILQSLGNKIPLVGGYITGALDSIINDALGLFLSFDHPEVQNVSGAIDVPSRQMASFADATRNAVDMLVQAVAHTRAVVIPRESAAVYAAVFRLVQALQVWTAGQLATVRAYALVLYHDAVALMLAEAAALESYATGLFAAAEGYATALNAEAMAYTTAAVAEANAYTTASVAAAEAYTTSVNAATLAYVQATSAADIAYTTAVEHEVLTYVDQEVAILQAEIAAVEGAVQTEVVTVVTPVVTEIATLRETCIDPLCENLNQYGKDLKKLGSIWELAALLAYVAASVADPAGTAQTVNELISPIATGTLDVVRTITGP